MIRVLFDQRVIPNYRVGVYRKLAEQPDIRLTVSHWTDRFTDPTPHIVGDLGFDTVAFTPVRFRVNGKHRWFNLDLVKYVLRNRPDVIIGPLGMFGINTIVSKTTESLLTLLTGKLQ